MSKIRFTEPRQLLSGELVAEGDERDFGEAENSAFVRNQVAEWVATAPAAPAEAAAQEEVTHG